MQDYRIAICDDEAVQTDYLAALVNDWGHERRVLLHIERFPSAEAFWFRYAAARDFDILLLDIEMGGMNGVELARRIRREDKELQLLFVTGYMEYISDGYDVEALHYLLKPVTAERLYGVLDRARERLAERGKSLFLKAGEETVRVPLYDIRYLEVRQNYVTVHAGEEYTVKKTLQELEKELDGSFFRTGRSYIVNLRFVKKIARTEVSLADGAVVPLSRGLYDRMNRALISYF